MVKTEERKDIIKIEVRENIKEIGKGISQTGIHKTVSTTPSSWWEDRKRIEQPVPEDQEKRYREEQERFKQEKQMRVEGEGNNNMVKKIKEREDIKEERKGISQTGFHKTVSTTPSSWWEDRKRIEQPVPEDQEKHYREEQERFKQENQRAEYYRLKQETVRPGQEHQEKFEPKKQMRIEGEENPWLESTEALFGKAFGLSNASPETFKEFHTLWMNTYQEAFGRLFDIQSMRPSKEVLKYFVQSENINLNLYKSWIGTLEKLSQKAEEQSAYLEKNKEFCNLWVKMYGKAFDNFFKNTPSFSMSIWPVQNAAKIYTDMFNSMSNIGVKSYNTSKEAV